MEKIAQKRYWKGVKKSENENSKVGNFENFCVWHKVQYMSKLRSVIFNEV